MSIIPEFGANVNELVLRNREGLFSIIDGDKYFEQLIKNKFFREQNLFPSKIELIRVFMSIMERGMNYL